MKSNIYIEILISRIINLISFNTEDSKWLRQGINELVKLVEQEKEKEILKLLKEGKICTNCLKLKGKAEVDMSDWCLDCLENE